MKREIKQFIRRIYNGVIAHRYGELKPTVRLDRDVVVFSPKNLFLADYTRIDHGAVIMNTRAKFVMKKNSGAAFGLSVITGNHMSIPGMWLKDVTDKMKDEFDINHLEDQDVIVDEEVWIGSNVTLLKGVHIGRGSIIGAGSVVRKNVPPYAIVTGNPAKVVGFRFTPSIILEHEESLYSEQERLSEDVLIENYNKYFVSKISEIQQYLK